MAKNKAAKLKPVKKIESKVEKKLKKKKVAVAKKETQDESDNESFGPEEIQKLLEPYTKDQLIEFLIDAAVKDTSLFNRISEAADRDVSHRKIFIHGLGWDTTRETLVSSFESYGEIEDCNVVTDRATGKAKGYGFVLFKKRQGARKALKEPRKKINNRVASCQLASVGPMPQQQGQDSTGRKIYVSNVQADADPEKLRVFFAKFGEIETGPIGFDMQTGKSRGFALFVYKTLEGARKVLEEPYKMFEGQQLHCQKAADGKNKVGASASVTTAMQPLQGPLLAAVAAAQNLALYSQHPSLNPMYSGLLANSNPGLISTASANPIVAGGGLGQGLLGSSQVGGGLLGSAATGLGGYGASASHGSASLGGPSSVLRAHGSGTPALQGLQHAYPNPQIGQSSAARGVGGAFSGYPSYMCPRSMNTASVQFVTSRRMGIYEPTHQNTMWGESFRGNSFQNTSASAIVVVDGKLDIQSEDLSNGTLGPSNKYDQEASKPSDKTLRRLAQNREAARKSRLRKKAYVQQLETSRLKLIQLEQELEQTRQQGSYIDGRLDAGHLGCSGTGNAAIAAFEMDYGHWVEEQNRQVCELRVALHSNLNDIGLRMLVDGGMSHYAYLFRMKATAAKADVFYVTSGMWRSPAERLFLWIGGFRPSELLKVLVPQLDTLTDQQFFDACNLRQLCQQAEDAFTQGMERLQQTLAESVAADRLGEGRFTPQMTTAMENLEGLVRFVNQADHLRQETLQQMSRILTTRQAARGLIALGEYFQRLRALSSLWATRPCEPA